MITVRLIVGKTDMNKQALKAIRHFYGDRCAARSGVPLIKHIDEGLAVLRHIGASDIAKEAFCIHPKLQSDADLKISISRQGSVFQAYALNPEAIAVAMEYRHIANSYLSHHCITGEETINLGCLDEVREMLIADKVQNLKDFERFHLGTHPNNDQLVRYFDAWLVRLNITPDRYLELCKVMGDVIHF